jgi:murein DD-endopeptidase MepM/ murein hydrolase activator NlpD
MRHRNLTLTLSRQKDPRAGTEQKGRVADLYKQSEFGFGQGMGVAALSRGDIVREMPIPAFGARIARRSVFVDLVPDLGLDIGSATWFRGAASCLILCGAAIALVPEFPKLGTNEIAVLDTATWEERRALSIAPLANGADSGKRMAAGGAVVEISGTPERPAIDLVATMGQGDGFGRVLERAGVGRADAASVARLVGQIAPVSSISPGTLFKLTLGRRANARQVRPLERMAFRVRFDLNVEIVRGENGLDLKQSPIVVDDSPIRIQGKVGDSLYQSARAAGVPSSVAQDYIRVIASKISLGNDVGESSRFDIVVEHQRAETGEVRFGKLLYASIDNGGRRTQLLPWTINGKLEWLDPKGLVQSRRASGAPVANARLTSGFGMRFHPLLGYNRMHQGVDYAASYGTPIYAVADGRVQHAGWHGGHGKMVKIAHGGGLGTGYAHMSRIAVAAGSLVRQGDVIGYVGSTGLSTGPHLHFEAYRNGVAVNPRRFAFVAPAALSGQQLASFKARLNWLTNLPISGRKVGG